MRRECTLRTVMLKKEVAKGDLFTKEYTGQMNRYGRPPSFDEKV